MLALTKRPCTPPATLYTHYAAQTASRLHLVDGAAAAGAKSRSRSSAHPTPAPARNSLCVMILRGDAALSSLMIGISAKDSL